MDLPAKRRVQGCPAAAAAGTEPAVRGEGLCFGVLSPTGLGQSRKGSTGEWSPAELCRRVWELL